jgi:hypothetical protein
LDEKFAAQLSACIGVVEIKWFYSLYRISAKYDLFGLLNGITALNNFLDKNPIDSVIVYGENSFSILDNKGDLGFLVQSVFEGRYIDRKCDLQSRSINPIKKRGYRNAVSKMKNIIFRVALKGKEIIVEFRNYFYFSKVSSISILFESLYDFKFLRLGNKIGPTLIWAYYDDPWVLGKSTKDVQNKVMEIRHAVSNIDFVIIRNQENSITSIAMNILVKRMQNDLVNNISSYAYSLLKMKKLLQTNSKVTALWGNDPAVGKKALLVDYLLKSNIKIIGYQHGASYGVQSDIEHFHSAYSFCNVFFSYGFTRNDLPSRITNDSTFNTIIYPVGSVRIQAALAKKATDKKALPAATIFYPVTNLPGILCTSRRRKADKFLDIQKKILSFLNTIGDKNNIIKLPPGTTDTPSCHEISFHRYPTLSLVSDKVLNIMNKYDVKSVLIDACFSTCLYEVLGYDCEIFVIHDELVPFDKEPLELLKKRVYYLETIDSFYEVYKIFMEGRLEKKRNSEFMERHVVNRSIDSKVIVIDKINEAIRDACTCE